MTYFFARNGFPVGTRAPETAVTRSGGVMSLFGRWKFVYVSIVTLVGMKDILVLQPAIPIRFICLSVPCAHFGQFAIIGGLDLRVLAVNNHIMIKLHLQMRTYAYQGKGNTRESTIIHI